MKTPRAKFQEHLNGIKLLEKNENSAAVEFSVSETSPYFDGHFPGFSLLPAVAQVELVIRFASEYFETGIDILEMRRIKFTKFVRPNLPLRLELEKKDKTVSFKLITPGGQEVYSRGIIEISEKRETGV